MTEFVAMVSMDPTLSELIRESFENSWQHGFHDEYADIGDGDVIDHDKLVAAIPAKIALLHSEISEALEEYRNLPKGQELIDVINARITGGNSLDDLSEIELITGMEQLSILSTIRYVDRKPEGFLVELADELIRIFDLVGAMGAESSFIHAVRIKMAYNRARPHMHGKLV